MTRRFPQALAVIFCAFNCVSPGVSDNGAASEVNTSECLTALNLGRSGKLDFRQQVLGNNTSENDTIIEEFNTLVDSTCALKDPQMTPIKAGGLLLESPNKSSLEGSDIKELIQDEITKGLKAMGSNPEKLADITDPSAQNLVLLMYPKATKVVCAASKGCRNRNTRIFCRFDKSPGEDDTPFSDEQFEALQAREASGIRIPELDKSALNTPLTPNKKPAPDSPFGNFATIPSAATAVLAVFTILHALYQ